MKFTKLRGVKNENEYNQIFQSDLVIEIVAARCYAEIFVKNKILRLGSFFK